MNICIDPRSCLTRGSSCSLFYLRSPRVFLRESVQRESLVANKWTEGHGLFELRLRLFRSKISIS